MLSGNYVSYETIVAKVNRYFGFYEQYSDEDALEWLSDFMAHTNVPKVLDDKIKYIKVENGRAKLPNDMHLIRSVATVRGVNSVDEAECGEGMLDPMRWATDTFHMRYHCDDRDYTSSAQDTYTLNKGFIFPSFSEGILAISYKAIPVDDCGYPLIPSDEQWQKAAAYEIGYNIARKLLIKEEISAGVYQIIERDRDWYFAQAVNYSKVSMPLDEMESFKNDRLRTIPKTGMHNNFFANMQLPEQRAFRPKVGEAQTHGSGYSTLPNNVSVDTTPSS